MRKLITIIYTLIAVSGTTYAQSSFKTKYPNVGEQVSDHTFTDLVNYPEKTAKISDFKGKWLVIDFWGYTCTACIASFPKMDKFSQDFKDKVQLVMLAATKGEKGDSKEIERITKGLYNRLDKKNHFKFTVAFDSVLYNQWDVGAVPQIFVVDPQGIIRAKVSKLDSLDMVMLMEGKQPNFEQKASYSRSEPRGNVNYNQKLLFLTTGSMANGGIDTAFMFRSLLSLQNSKAGSYNVLNLYDTQPVWNVDISNGRLEIFGHKIINLYKAAFLGKSYWNVNEPEFYDNFYPNILVEGNDKEIENFLSSKTKYNYSLKVPKDRSNKDFIMSIMQNDLNNYFPYHAKLEIREMPVYYIRIADKKKVEKLRTKGNSETKDETATKFGLALKNTPFKKFINLMISGMYSKIPVFDSTNFVGNVDVKFDNVSSVDFEGYSAQLANMGFRVDKGFKKMKTITISK